MNMYDTIGIGFGPANISLAIALEEIAPHLNVRFVEARSSSQWHPEMMLPGADIQNHPLRDLVTPRNPQSFYTFTNFLKVSGRLFEHLNLGTIFPLRAEYIQYIAWVAQHFDSLVDYNTVATKVDPLFDGNGHHEGYEISCSRGKKYRARTVVIAPGRTPYMPDALASFDGSAIHFTQLKSSLRNLDRAGRTLKKIAVVGSSQSAAEIVLELRARYPNAEITLIHRCFGLRQKDLSPFTGEVFFPEFVDLYHDSDGNTRKNLDADLKYTNYSAADRDVLDRLYLRIYDDKISNKNKINIMRGCEIVDARALTENRVLLDILCKYTGNRSELDCDLVIAATGFRNIGSAPDQESIPLLLRSMQAHLQLDRERCVTIQRDYSVSMAPSLNPGLPLVLNGLCEKSHGMGDAGSFSLLSLRAEIIVGQLSKSADEPNGIKIPQLADAEWLFEYL